MPSSIKLENIVEEEVREGLPDKGYSGQRFYAAAQFAKDCVTQNRVALCCDVPVCFHLKEGLSECKNALSSFYSNDSSLKNPIKFAIGIKKLFAKISSQASMMAAETLKKPLSYTTALNSFGYALLALNYSFEDNNYYFIKKSKLSVFRE